MQASNSQTKGNRAYTLSPDRLTEYTSTQGQFGTICQPMLSAGNPRVVVRGPVQNNGSSRPTIAGMLRCELRQLHITNSTTSTHICTFFHSI